MQWLIPVSSLQQHNTHVAVINITPKMVDALKQIMISPCFDMDNPHAIVEAMVDLKADAFILDDKPPSCAFIRDYMDQDGETIFVTDPSKYIQDDTAERVHVELELALVSGWYCASIIIHTLTNKYSYFHGTLPLLVEDFQQNIKEN